MNEEQQDKILKEKLQQMQVPFDANAWVQMEAILNNEKKKRGFIFWWVGVCSALFLMGGTTFYFYNHAEKNIADANNIINADNVITEPIIHSAEKNNTLYVLNTSANTIRTKGKMNDNGGNDNMITDNNNQRNNATFMSSRGSKKSKRNITAENYSDTENVIAAAEKNAAYNEALIASFVASIDKIIFEATAMQLIDVKHDEEDKTTIKAPHKKKVHYALGISGIVAATSVGRQQGDSPFFFHKPYYAAGIYHEVLFGKRIALTNAFHFAKNYFEISNPNNNIFIKQPEKYTCDITMLNIPLGLKYHIVSKEKIRWYVHAGINNHIKLKENFEFTIYPIDTLMPSAEVIPTNVSVQTNLNGGSNAQFESQDFASGSGYSRNNTIATTNEFSVNNARRYYLSAYFATGVEYILKNKWHFFVEPTYQFSINAIGIQERRVHHMGMGSGMRVAF